MPIKRLFVGKKGKLIVSEDYTWEDHLSDIVDEKTKIPVVNQFGKWRINKDNSVEFLPNTYQIAANRLTEGDWISHLMEKNWMEGHLEDFMKAYWEAMRRQGIGQIIQRVY